MVHDSHHTGKIIELCTICRRCILHNETNGKAASFNAEKFSSLFIVSLAPHDTGVYSEAWRARIVNFDKCAAWIKHTHKMVSFIHVVPHTH